MKRKPLTRFSKFLTWASRESGEFAANLSRDLRSLRSLFNILYLALYMFLCVWAALYYAKECLNTAIVTTGGLVSAIFTGYVWSKTKERELEHRSAAAKIVVQEEQGESD